MKRLSLIIVAIVVLGVLPGTWWLQNDPKPAAVPQEIISPPPIPDLEAWGAVLINEDDGEVVYGKNALKSLYPASTTKILTALLALETCSPHELVTVGEEVNFIAANGSRAGLKPGNKLSMHNLIYCLLLPSGNDAAYTIAVHVGRVKTGRMNLPIDEAMLTFRDMMNQRAKQIGALNSHFVNPDGYHHSEHYSTPYDMALIAREAMKNPLFRQVVGTPRYLLTDISNQKMELKNTNELLFPENPNHLASATGIKTGHTTPAGACLVSSADCQYVNLIAVVMHSNDKKLYSDSKLLLNYGMQTLDQGSDCQNKSS